MQRRIRDALAESPLGDAVERGLAAAGFADVPLCVYARSLQDDVPDHEETASRAAADDVVVDVKRATEIVDVEGTTASVESGSDVERIVVPSFDELDPSDFVALATRGDAGEGETAAAVVGWVFLTVERPVTVDDRGVSMRFDGPYLWGLFVVPSHRRHGVGTALVAAATAFAAAGRDERLYALVAADNAPSRGLFDGLGFDHLETVPRYRLPWLGWRFSPFSLRRAYGDVP